MRNRGAAAPAAGDDSRARLPRPVLTIGEHDLPEVVPEVDHTTDARRRKLGQYEAWGFPEVWVEVPEACAESVRAAGARD